ncbi:hypothetical protein HDU67_006035 [Dinochytrium kinnereticum]|nr:hypothetical protein HDU67_006035 [Dinochytrium kinnereticum]
MTPVIITKARLDCSAMKPAGFLGVVDEDVLVDCGGPVADFLGEEDLVEAVMFSFDFFLNYRKFSKIRQEGWTLLDFECWRTGNGVSIIHRLVMIKRCFAHPEFDLTGKHEI